MGYLYVFMQQELKLPTVCGFLCILCRFAFIDFNTVEEAQSAMKKMNNKILEGRPMWIGFAETREGGKLMFQMCS